MTRWMAVIERWNEYAIALTAFGGEWMRALVPAFIAALAGGAVALIVSQERIANAQALLDELREQVGKNAEVIVRTDERLARAQQDIIQILHTHEALKMRVEDLSEFSTKRCLVCHMTKAVNHPSRKTVPYP